MILLGVARGREKGKSRAGPIGRPGEGWAAEPRADFITVVIWDKEAAVAAKILRAMGLSDRAPAVSPARPPSGEAFLFDHVRDR